MYVEGLRYLFLRTMANKDAIANRFIVTISSAHRSLRRVTEAVLDVYPQNIKWPKGEYLHTIKDTNINNF